MKAGNKINEDESTVINGIKVIVGYFLTCLPFCTLIIKALELIISHL